MAGYSWASWAIGVLLSDCITKDTPPPFTSPNTTFGYPPLGQSEGDFEFGALGLGVSRTGGIVTMVELADQLHRSIQRMEPAIPVVADVHPPSTDRTVAVQDVELPQGEIRVRRPSVSHPADLRDHEPASNPRDQFSRYVRNTRSSSPFPDR